ncbi:hypothetical protein M406DRAFT_53729, partial [Cryphonectria parasitica EP155]
MRDEDLCLVEETDQPNVYLDPGGYTVLVHCRQMLYICGVSEMHTHLCTCS